MCLVLKLDNGKVVSIANGQNHRWTESPNYPVPYWYIDSGYKNKKIGFYPKSLRLFLRILCVVEDSIHVCRRNFSCAPGDLARN